MESTFVPIVIVFLVIVAPLWLVFHYTNKWKTSKSLSSDDEQMLAELWESAQKMESRINTLETILDAEVPDWRRKV